ncbi:MULTISPECIES: glyoxalase superfamily protein [Ectopseudomonas]|jgi:hypothetical protein|uniref:Glyoxalase-related protein domain-containing protein n=2 Tax=Ectopseudomonas TaxID=3236654 RepID=A0A1G6PYG6_9GAMM|nr:MULTISPECIES: glyoxalase superfamily protein [Pseudomonas]ALN21866.1 hypothetical protein DW68_024625 [Pseudomonas mendocina S5.2]KER98079.1 hypothetical protein HN51_25085 [Pseudomonas mendocina]MBP3061962.1 hypothetical protein [Pseudomonas chengduensis]NNB75255.1 hypothetical protein [Pseudomonas chengduensis]SDC84556.1 hypothetical protein SAMN05216576_107132 [Pseudomonas chengduensis]
MTSDSLKSRAKRLRTAVTDMLKVPVTHSQSLELVAKEENFPNWDAACASYGRPKQGQSAAPATTNIRVSVQSNQTPSVATIFSAHEPTIAELNRLMDLSDTRGALVLIAGPTMQGRTTTANVIMGELALERTGTRERLSRTSVRPDEDFPLGHRLKLIDEIRDDRIAFEAVAYALAGVKVVAVIHARDGLERLRVLLRSYGAGESFLDQLLAEGQALSVFQELDWPDASMLHQARTKREEAMLRQHGLDADQAQMVAAQGSKAVLDTLLSSGASQ